MFKLIFLGPQDSSPLTLQRIKGVLLADLELEIPKIVEILDKLPSQVMESERREDLKKAYSLLKSAGANLEITGETPQSNESTIALEADSADQSEAVSAAAAAASPNREHALDSRETGDLEFEMILDEEDLGIKAPPKAARKKVYEINLEEDTGIDPILSTDLGQGQDVTEQKTSQVTAPPETKPTAQLKADKPALDNALVLDLESPDTPPENPAAPQADLAKPEAPAPRAVRTDDDDFVLTINLEDEPPKITPPQENQPPQSSKAAAQKSTLENPFSLSDAATPEVQEPPKKTDSQTLDSPDIKLYDTREPSASNNPKAQITAADAKPHLEPDISSDDSTPSAISAPPPPEPYAPFSSKPKRKLLPLDIGIPILIGSIILGLGNWYYFSGSESSSSAMNEIVQSTVAEGEHADDASQTAAPSAELPIEEIYAADLKDEARSLSAKVSMASGASAFQTVTLSIVRPDPPALTKEELVEGKGPPLWLKRIEVRNLRFAKTENNKATAHGAAFAFLLNNRDSRVTGQAIVSAELLEDKQEIKLDIKISSANLDSDGSDIDWIENSPERGLRFYYATQFSVKKQ